MIVCRDMFMRICFNPNQPSSMCSGLPFQNSREAVTNNCQTYMYTTDREQEHNALILLTLHAASAEGEPALSSRRIGMLGLGVCMFSINFKYMRMDYFPEQ